ncbi:MAG: DUF2617 family protein [Planctomycetota bacterium]|nr:MAG: DUF2617 family protein [Planctomycetota bacterium]
MSLAHSRTSVADAVLTAYERPLHPELFHCRGHVRLDQGTLRAELRICDNGHWFEFLVGGRTVVAESVAPIDQELPDHLRIVRRPIRGSREFSFPLGRPPVAMTYHVCFQVETVDPEVFKRLQEEFERDARNATLAVRFPPQHRWGPAPLSLFDAESLKCGIVVHAVHTFPEEFSVVKTQTLVELSSTV